MTRKITLSFKTAKPVKGLRTTRRIRTRDKLPKADPAQITNAMYRQDVAPFSEGLDALVQDMARALPEWTNKLAHDTAGARAGLFLRTMRNAAGLTQVQLGEMARMKQSDISDLENGKGAQGPGFDVIARVADACGFYVTFEVKRASTTHKTQAAAVEAARREVQHYGGGRVVRTYVMGEDGQMQEFEGTSPSLNKDETILLDDAAGRVLKVSIDRKGATVEIAEAEAELAAAVHHMSAAG
jgi:transcriptional regulator with XRE-family HTH domain